MHRPPASRYNDGVKPDAIRDQPSLRQENFCGPRNSLLLSRQERFLCIAMRFPCLDFDKTENPTGGMGNEVDFSRMSPYAAADDSVTLEDEQKHRKEFAPPAPALRQLVTSGF